MRPYFLSLSFYLAFVACCLAQAGVLETCSNLILGPRESRQKFIFRDPRDLIRENQLALEKFTFRFEESRDSGGQFVGFFLKAFYDGERIGDIYFFTAQDEKTYLRVDSAIGVFNSRMINGEKIFFRGVGLGTLMYLTGAQYAYDRYGRIVYSNDFVVNENSGPLWDRLVRWGWAEEFGVRRNEYRFREKVLQGGQFHGLLNWVESCPENP